MFLQYVMFKMKKSSSYSTPLHYFYFFFTFSAVVLLLHGNGFKVITITLRETPNAG